MNKVGQLLNNPPDPRSRAESSHWPLNDCYVGLEFEWERVVRRPTLRWWSWKEDHSLRNDGWELVLSVPLCGGDLDAALDEMDCLRQAEPRLTHRCGTHVHIDVRDLDLAQLARFILLATATEPVLWAIAGEGREQSAYCTSMTGSTNLSMFVGGLVSSLPHPAHTQGSTLRNMEGFSRYSSINLNAIPTYGSIEFRHFEGTTDVEYVRLVVKALQKLKKHAMESNWSPAVFPELVSSYGPLGFLLEVFGDVYPSLAEHITDSSADFNNKIYTAMRTAQYALKAHTLAEESHELRKYIFQNVEPTEDRLNFPCSGDAQLSSLVTTFASGMSSSAFSGASSRLHDLAGLIGELAEAHAAETQGVTDWEDWTYYVHHDDAELIRTSEAMPDIMLESFAYPEPISRGDAHHLYHEEHYSLAQYYIDETGDWS